MMTEQVKPEKLWRVNGSAYYEEGSDHPMADIDFWEDDNNQWWFARIQVCANTIAEAGSVASRITAFLNKEHLNDAIAHADRITELCTVLDNAFGTTSPIVQQIRDAAGNARGHLLQLGAVPPRKQDVTINMEAVHAKLTMHGIGKKETK